MIELEAAIERILAALPKPQAGRVELPHAHRRILAERIVSSVALPAFDNSAVDGYAVRAADLQGASADSPKTLRLIGRVAAGETFAREVSAGTCVRLFTGSPLPRGADAVAWQEDTQIEAEKPDMIGFRDVVKPWENIRFQGEDIKVGAVLAESGDALTVGRVGLLAATGIREVSVGQCPKVGLLATGSELLEAGVPIAPGKIFESNRQALAVLSENAGATAKIFPLVKDTLADTRAALETAFRECDMVVTSGGVSVGEMDFVKSAFEGIGGRLEFWKVSIRPGRPFVFGRLGENKFLFGLPGNPVSAFVTFLLLVRPAILRWQGATATQLSKSPGTLVEPISNTSDRRHFARVIVDAAGQVRSAGTQSSHMMSSLASANGLLDVLPQTTLSAGTMVQVLHWE